MNRLLVSAALFFGMGLAGGLPCWAQVATLKKPPLSYADGPLDPYYPHRDYPKLITPQWVGDEGVQCVVTLAIDDMRESAKYETYLRPILDRLKQIDGRAPVSVMSCSVNPLDPQLKKWLAEGLSIEVHTFDHPCPCLQGGDFAKAKATYEKCVDLMNLIPGNKPVAFRMPCCDSKNTPSPRFWQHVFNETTPYGNFLQIDSSVFNIVTKDDDSLPKEITQLEDGSERFRRYLPFPNFVNTINDYPYPYVIGGVCWEFPCVVPSDWSAQHVQKPYNPDTVRDLKIALDAAVLKQGTFNLVFHPHGWIRNDQVVELIDHAVTKHGKKVKFLNFRECLERLNKILLNGETLRSRRPKLPDLADENNDGYLDVRLAGRDGKERLLTWNVDKAVWNESIEFDERFVLNEPLLRRDIDSDGGLEGIGLAAIDRQGKKTEKNQFVLSRDIPGSERTEQVLLQPIQTELNAIDLSAGSLRFIDVNGDRKLDLLFSNHERYALYLFRDFKSGWSLKMFDDARDSETAKKPIIPPFVRFDGTNNGVWFHSGAIWLQNEDTAKLPDGVEKLLFKDLLKSP